MSDDLEYLARREREREQAEKEELQAAKEERWRKEGKPRRFFGVDPEYEAWKERTGSSDEYNAVPQALTIVLVVLGLFIFAVVFGPCS